MLLQDAFAQALVISRNSPHHENSHTHSTANAKFIPSIRPFSVPQGLSVRTGQCSKNTMQKGTPATQEKLLLLEASGRGTEGTGMEFRQGLITPDGMLTLDKSPPALGCSPGSAYLTGEVRKLLRSSS